MDQNGEPINGAIRDLDCFTTVVADDSSNRQPVIVDTFTVSELYMEQVINSTTLRGPFQDGDVITHTSISSRANLTGDSFPNHLELTLSGENSYGITVVNTAVIEYTANCNEWPVYPANRSMIGWVEIVSLLFSLFVDGFAHFKSFNTNAHSFPSRVLLRMPWQNIACWPRASVNSMCFSFAKE